MLHKPYSERLIKTSLHGVGRYPAVSWISFLDALVTSNYVSTTEPTVYSYSAKADAHIPPSENNKSTLTHTEHKPHYQG